MNSPEELGKTRTASELEKGGTWPQGNSGVVQTRTNAAAKAAPLRQCPICLSAHWPLVARHTVYLNQSMQHSTVPNTGPRKLAAVVWHITMQPMQGKLEKNNHRLVLRYRHLHNKTITVVL